jgi:accessory gene regulator protein AgrB
MVSDFIFLGFVFTSYLAFKRHLYKYAYLKSIICTILLVFNFIFLVYGSYIIAEIPSNYNSGASYDR